MGTTFTAENMMFLLTHSGQLRVTRDGHDLVLDTRTEKAARLALTKWNIAYGYAYGTLNATDPDPRHSDATSQTAHQFADAYAALVFRTYGQAGIGVADAYATWEATGQVTGTTRHRHTPPAAHTLDDIRDATREGGTGWEPGTRFIEIGPPGP